MSRFRSILSIELVVAILFFYFTIPFFVWNIPAKQYVDFLLQILLVVIFYKHKRLLTNGDLTLILFYISVWVFYMFQLYKSGRNLFGLLEHVPIAFYFTIFFCKRDFYEKILTRYIDIYTLMIFLSLSAWLISSLVPIGSSGVIQHYGEADRFYDVYPFFVRERLLVDSFRFYGPFDEPGVVGTTGAMLLCLLNFNFKDKRTWVLLVSGLFSMSFFFYAIVAVYSILYLLLVKKMIPQAMFLVVIYGAFYYFTQDNSIMSEVIWNRFSFDQETGKFVGDNRIDNRAVEYFNKTRGTSEYFWGVRDLETYWKFARGSSSYLNIIAMYGAVFLFSYCSYFLVFALKYKRNIMSFCLFALFFLINLYQRANIYSVLWVFLYTSLARGSMINKLSHG